MVACLNDHGIPATLGPDYTISGGASARAVHKEIREECFREVDPSYAEDPPPFTEAQLESLYGYLQKQVARFVESGYPQVEMPAFERFSTDLEGRFHPVRALIEEFGVFPTMRTSQRAGSETDPPGSSRRDIDARSDLHEGVSCLGTPYSKSAYCAL